MYRLLLRNMYRNRRRYVGYLLASTLAVATFFSFGFLASHPELQQQELPDILTQLLLIGQVGVACFAIFFVIFFHRFLLRLRGSEFGLLLTLGISPRRLARMIAFESVMLAMVSFPLGLLLSVAFTAVLMPGLGTVLGIPPMQVVFTSRALLTGCGFFCLVFGADAVLSARLVRVFTPRHLLLTARTGQAPSFPAIRHAVVGIGCLLVAYTLALVVSSNEIAGTLTMLPIVVLCAIGTYVLFRQVLVLILGTLRRRTVSGLVLLIAGRLIHRVVDYTRILTVVTLLSAGVLTLMSVITGALAYVREVASSPAEYQAMLQIVALSLFVSVFLSILCFVAAGSTLYVKIFTQLEEDRREAVRLRRIGLSSRQIGWILLGEFALLFFAPIAVAIIHSAVAVGEVTLHIIPDAAPAAIRGTWQAYGLVVAAYISIFVISWGITWHQYRHQVVQV